MVNVNRVRWSLRVSIDPFELLFWPVKSLSSKFILAEKCTTNLMWHKWWKKSLWRFKISEDRVHWYFGISEDWGHGSIQKSRSCNINVSLISKFGNKQRERSGLANPNFGASQRRSGNQNQKCWIEIGRFANLDAREIQTGVRVRAHAQNQLMTSLLAQTSGIGHQWPFPKAQKVSHPPCVPE